MTIVIMQVIKPVSHCITPIYHCLYDSEKINLYTTFVTTAVFCLGGNKQRKCIFVINHTFLSCATEIMRCDTKFVNSSMLLMIFTIYNIKHIKLICTWVLPICDLRFIALFARNFYLSIYTKTVKLDFFRQTFSISHFNSSRIIRSLT